MQIAIAVPDVQPENKPLCAVIGFHGAASALNWDFYIRKILSRNLAQTSFSYTSDTIMSCQLIPVVSPVSMHCFLLIIYFHIINLFCHFAVFHNPSLSSVCIVLYLIFFRLSSVPDISPALICSMHQVTIDSSERKLLLKPPTERWSAAASTLTPKVKGSIVIKACGASSFISYVRRICWRAFVAVRLIAPSWEVHPSPPCHTYCPSM